MVKDRQPRGAQQTKMDKFTAAGSSAGLEPQTMEKGATLTELQGPTGTQILKMP